MINLLVDKVNIATQPGRNLLSVCLENDIYVPHLCFLEDDDYPVASCRLCFVEIDGESGPVPACTITVAEGLRVTTDTEAVRRLQRSALRLLLSVHDVDCRHCHANHACALQEIAGFLGMGLKPKPLAHIERSKDVDTSHPSIDHYPQRCVLCGKCIRICKSLSLHGRPAFSFTARGIDTVIHHYPLHDGEKAQCLDCQRCIEICPVGALKLRDR